MYVRMKPMKNTKRKVKIGNANMMKTIRNVFAVATRQKAEAKAIEDIIKVKENTHPSV